MRRELAGWFKRRSASVPKPVDAADMGIEFGLEVSLAEAAEPIRPAQCSRPTRAQAPAPARRSRRSLLRGKR